MGLNLDGIRVLSAVRHRHKLRLGHLAGNRFAIRIRRVNPEALAAARDIFHVLEDIGVPNRFGAQRYGALGNSHRIGRAILRGDFAAAAREIVGDPDRISDQRWRQGAEAFAAGNLAEALAALPGHCRNERAVAGALLAGRSPRQAVLGLPRRLLRLYLSACQSFLFDRLVTMRLASLETLWEGDLACKHANGACFLVRDPAVEQPRADRFEISPSGPLFGYKAPLAQGRAGILEEGLLEKEELTRESFRLAGGLAMEGERRPLRVPLAEAQARQEGDDLLLSFVLPKGSYATSVLHEVMKTAPDTQGG